MGTKFGRQIQGPDKVGSTKLPALQDQGRQIPGPDKDGSTKLLALQDQGGQIQGPDKDKTACTPSNSQIKKIAAKIPSYYQAKNRLLDPFWHWLDCDTVILKKRIYLLIE